MKKSTKNSHSILLHQEKPKRTVPILSDKTKKTFSTIEFSEAFSPSAFYARYSSLFQKK